MKVMIGDYLPLLLRRDTLLALGVCLVVVGIVLRGFARSNRRDQAYRKQHRLDNPEGDLAQDRTDQHLEKNLPRYAAACLLGGFALVVVAFFR
jgi:hypothetical protein